MLKTKDHSSCKKITFSANGLVLRGTLHLPAAENPPIVIGSHGLCSSSNSPKQVELARKCNAQGIAFLRFDHRGCGHSDGVYKEVTSFDGRCDDLIRAIQTVQTRNDVGNQIGLFGSSMGGTVCISVAATYPVAALVTFAAPVTRRSVISSGPKIPGSRSPTHSFYRKILKSDISDKLSSLHHILIFHGEADTVVPPDNARQIFALAGEPKKLIMQTRGDHRMSNKKHQGDFVREAVAWFKKCFNHSI